MIFTLFVISALLALFGIYSFIRKKTVVGVFSLLAGLMGVALGLTVIYFYPEKLWF